MATVKPPADTRFWSSAGTMPEDMTPSEVRLAQQIQLFRNEMRIAHDGIYKGFGFVNIYTPVLLLNSIGLAAVLVKLFW